LKRGADSGVECVLIGGIAARVHGSHLFTEDLDLAISLAIENVVKLSQSLADLNPRF
jgi:hypothetical protein